MLYKIFLQIQDKWDILEMPGAKYHAATFVNTVGSYTQRGPTTISSHKVSKRRTRKLIGRLILPPPKNGCS